MVPGSESLTQASARWNSQVPTSYRPSSILTPIMKRSLNGMAADTRRWADGTPMGSVNGTSESSFEPAAMLRLSGLDTQPSKEHTMSKYSTSPTATSDFPTAGDDEATVDNVSAERAGQTSTGSTPRHGHRGDDRRAPTSVRSSGRDQRPDRRGVRRRAQRTGQAHMGRGRRARPRPAHTRSLAQRAGHQSTRARSSRADRRSHSSRAQPPGTRPCQASSQAPLRPSSHAVLICATAGLAARLPRTQACGQARLDHVRRSAGARVVTTCQLGTERDRAGMGMSAQGTEDHGVDDDRSCLQCGQSLSGLRSDARWCSKRCKRQARRQAPSSNYQPPPAGNSVAQDRSDREWRRQIAAEEIRAEPASEEEIRAVALQRRNQGPLVPFFQRRVDERNRAELEAREAAVRDRRAICVGIPARSWEPGLVAAAGRASRALNRPQEPYRELHRPVPWADEAEMSDAPEGWRRGRR